MTIAAAIKARILQAVATGASYRDAAAPFNASRSAVAGLVDRARQGGSRGAADGAEKETACTRVSAAPRETARVSPPGGCRWIDGDPRRPSWRFCGAPAVGPERSWCAAHRAQVFKPGN